MKHRSGENPDKDDKHGSGKSPGASESDRGASGKDPKYIANYAKEIPLLFLILEVFGFGFHTIALTSRATRQMVANGH
jgi:hypothetical protein